MGVAGPRSSAHPGGGTAWHSPCAKGRVGTPGHPPTPELPALGPQMRAHDAAPARPKGGPMATPNRVHFLKREVPKLQQTGTCAALPPAQGSIGREGTSEAAPKRLGRRLEEVAKAVGGGYCRLQMPLRLALGVRGTVAGRRLGALEGGGVPSPPFQCIPAPAPHPPHNRDIVITRACHGRRGKGGVCPPLPPPKKKILLRTSYGTRRTNPGPPEKGSGRGSPIPTSATTAAPESHPKGLHSKAQSSGR